MTLPEWLAFPDWWSGNLPRFLEALQTASWWLLARYAGQSLLVALLIAASDFLFGAALLRLVAPRFPVALRGAVSLALGSGLAGLALFLLATAGRLTVPGVIILTSALAVFGLAMLRRGGALAWAARSFAILRPRWWALLLVPFLLLQIGDLMMPVLEYDSTMYHMSAGRWYIDHASLAFHPGIRYNAQPHLTVLLFVRQWLLSGDDSLAKLAQLEFLLMTVLLLAGVARRLRIPRGGALAFLFVFASPVLNWVSKVEYADFMLACYLGVAGGLILLAFRSRAAVLVPFGLVLGFAAATKFQGMLVAACLAGGYLLGALLSRWPLARVARHAAVIALLVAVSGAGWWIRSYIHTGSPVYPFLIPNDPDAQYLFAVSKKYGVARTPWDLLKLPVSAFTLSPYLFADVFRFGPPLLALALAGLLALRRGRPGSATLALLAPVVLYFAFWFQTGQVMRYLACLLPVMGILFLLALRRAPVWLCAVLVLCSARASLETSMLFRLGALPAVRYADRETLLAGSLRYYPAARELNRAAAPSDKIYLWFCDDIRYYVRNESFGDWFGPRNYHWVGRNLFRTDLMLLRLRQAGFRWIIVDRLRAKQMGVIYRGDFQESAFVAENGPTHSARLHYSDGRYAVFALP